jgi:hypothetical protein
MVLSDFALSVLKNFASIHPELVVKKGNLQRSMSEEGSILAEAELEEITDEDFGIDDLNLFLGNVGILKNPELTYSNGCLLISDGKFKLSYRPCVPGLLFSPPDKKLVIGEPDVSFDLSGDTLTKLLRLASVNELPSLVIRNNGTNIEMVVNDTKDDTSNEVSTVVCGGYSGPDFEAQFKVDSMKMIPGDYLVEMKIGKFSKFSSKTSKLVYYVGEKKKTR